MNIVFSSSVNRKHRDGVEALIFFNPQQEQARTGILKSVKKFGLPRLEGVADNLSVRLDKHAAQTIFAYNSDDPETEPVGVVVFVRCEEEELGVVHIAVFPEFSLSGCYGAAGLTFKLIDEVCRVGRKVKGVKRVRFFYHGEHCFPV